MIEDRWLSDQLTGLLRWQMANPGASTDPAPELPWAGRRIWAIFLDLHEARGSSGFGPNPISYTEIECYARVRREPIRPFEVEIIRQLDREFLQAVPSCDPNAAGTGGDAQSRSMSPQLFDALFH